VNLTAKIYVAGHQGLVGSALVRRLKMLGYVNLLLRTHQELDLTNQYSVQEFFAEKCPEYVFLTAAKVGGILANSSYPAEFLCHNLLIQTHVIHEAFRSGVRRLLFLGSSCIYPRHAPQPTNRSYAVAKISGIEMCWSYNHEYGTRFFAAMPTSLYGPGDRYHLQDSHVIPALIRRMHEAKISGADQIVLWGTGTPRREFLHSDDAADACVFLMKLPDERLDPIAANGHLRPIINVGSGEDLTIRKLSALIAEVVGFKKKIIFDPSKPDGTPRKLLDVSLLTDLGWQPRTPLREGLSKTYMDFLEPRALALETLPLSGSAA
jgi:GDP-L-fucose synthase